MPPRKTIPVSERALIQRINRALKNAGEMLKAARSPRVAEDIGRHFLTLKNAGEMLKAARSPRVAEDIGRHFLINLNRNFVLQKHVDVEALGRELGVLEDYEHVQDSE